MSGSLLTPLRAAYSAEETVVAPSKETATDLLIIGAGPFGLALAAYAQGQGISHRVVGAPMQFWRDNMPQGMILRSTCDWPLDPLGIHSIDAYLETLGKKCRDVEPLPRDFYLDYAAWFQREADIRSDNIIVDTLFTDGSDLVALTADGNRIRSRNVVLAIGFGNFAHVPSNLAAMFPRERYEHTCHLVNFEHLEGRRVLVIGGRQSAFEWTALIREAGAESIDVAYRHDTPNFVASDWSWVNDIVNGMSDDPGWYRRLGSAEKEQLNRRFWVEGRQKLEPWLASRIDHDNVRLHPRTNVVGARVGDSAIEVQLDSDEFFLIDEVVFATGYRVDLHRVPFLSDDLLSNLKIDGGYAPLDVHFQSKIPGLYITSMAATRDFGSFLAFTVSARAQAKVIGESVRQRLVQT